VRVFNIYIIYLFININIYVENMLRVRREGGTYKKERRGGGCVFIEITK